MNRESTHNFDSPNEPMPASEAQKLLSLIEVEIEQLAKSTDSIFSVYGDVMIKSPKETQSVNKELAEAKSTLGMVLQDKLLKLRKINESLYNIINSSAV